MPETLVPLTGLVLDRASIDAPQGSLADCLNFEKDQLPGLVRSRGWARYDGTVMGPELQDIVVINPDLTTWNGTPFQYGEWVKIQYGAPSKILTMLCVGWRSTGTPYLLLAYPWEGFPNWFNPTGIAPNFFTFTGQHGGFLGNITAATHLLNDGTVAPAVYDDVKALVQVSHSAAIGAVPGKVESPVDAVFGFANNIYALHDCVAFAFTNGVSGTTRPFAMQEGAVLKDATGTINYGTILSRTVTAGDFSAGAPASGTVVVYDWPLGQAVPAIGTAINVYTADGLTNTGGTAKFGATATSANSRALLYSTYEQYVNTTPYIDRPVFSLPHTWSRPRIGRELAYTQTNGLGFGPIGTNTYSSYEYTRTNLSQTLTALTPVATGYTYGSSFLTTPTAMWVNPNNVFADDGAYASLPFAFSPAYKPLITMQIGGFDFSAIPQDAVIVGLTCRLNWRYSYPAGSSSPFNLQQIKLILPDGTYSNNVAGTILPTTSFAYVTFGNQNSSWGAQLTPATLQDPAFGLYFAVSKFASTIGPSELDVDSLSLTVYYVPASRLVYIRNAFFPTPTDILAKIIHYSVESGSFDTGDATGTLTLEIGDAEWQGTDAGKPRGIMGGEEIRTAPAGGGQLLGYTAGSDNPISFPPSAALDNNTPPSRYEAIDANFWDDVDGRAEFFVNGVEFATMFDGTYFVRIRSGRTTGADNPRHVAAHGGLSATSAGTTATQYLFLGFDSGAVINTAAGHPLSTLGSPGYAVNNFGEQINGLATLNGQTLGVWTDRATRGLQGSTPISFTPITISPAVGCVEYTLASLVGQPVWTSYRGVETITTVAAYGDFTTIPLSMAATPWLQARLQVDNIISSRPAPPVYAVGVRNKRQYRLFFGDGYVYTQTLTEGDETTTGTLQYLTRSNSAPIPFNAPPYTGAVIRHVSHMTRADGKELIFAAFENQNFQFVGSTAYFPYATRLDCSRTNDADTKLTAWVTLNALYPAHPLQRQRFDTVTLWVSGVPNTTVSLYRQSIDDGPLMPTLPAAAVGSVPLRTQGMYANEVRYPFPTQAVTFSGANEGQSMVLRIDASADGSYNDPVRITHLDFSFESADVRES